MAVRRIIRMGHPTLRKPSRCVTPEERESAEFQTLILDMIETLHDYGGVGLAAPQINVPLRLAVIEIPDGHDRYGPIQEVPLTVFVNPRYEVVQEAAAGFWEGCLSIPGLRGYVERPQHIKVAYETLEGEPVEMELEGFLATVFQHEFDHLDGILYVDRIQDPTKLVFEEEFLKFGHGTPPAQEA